MYLKKLIVKGFKSFADKTVFNFSKGITVIVGPNGCGKSNFADAFRWVLGEKSARSLRGDKMTDVVFAGTASRGASDCAEVSLVLSDINHSLPVPYEEIIVTRRLYKNGESDYFLNQQPIRLKDLYELFLDSGLGKNAFSTFEQGKLDQVIQYTPMERRYIFDEAAGILRISQRKEEALKNLDEMELNLSRVMDLFKEIEAQINVLEKQAAEALIYKENKSKIEKLERIGYYLKFKQCEQKFEELEAEKKEKITASKVIVEDLNRNEELFSDLKKKDREIEINCRSLQEKLFDVKHEKDQLEAELRFLKEHVSSSLEKKDKLALLRQQLVESRQDWHREMESFEKLKESKKAALATVESKVSDQKDLVRHYEKECQRIRNDLQKFQQDHLKAVQEEGRLKGDLKQEEMRLEHVKEKEKSLKDRQAQLKEDCERALKTIEQKKIAAASAKDQLERDQKMIVEIQTEIKMLAGQLEQKQKTTEELRKRYIEKKARLTALISLRRDLEGYSSGSKQLLKEAERSNSTLYQKIEPLHSYIQAADPSTLSALSLILQPYTHTLIVKTVADLTEVMEFARKNSLEDYSIICIELLASIDSGMVSCLFGDIERNKVIDHLLKDVSLVDNESFFKKLVPNTIQKDFSLQAPFLVDSKGVLFHLKANKQHVFVREAEIKQIEKSIPEEEALIKEQEDVWYQLKQEREKLLKKLTDFEKQIKKQEMDLVELNFVLQKTEQDHQQSQKILLKSDEELAQFVIEREKRTQGVKKLQEEYRHAQQQSITLHETFASNEKLLQQQLGVIRLQQQSLREKESDYYRLLDEIKHITHQLNILLTKENENNKQLQRLEQEILDSQSNHEQHAMKIPEIESKLIDLSKDLERITNEKSNKENAQKDSRQEIDRLELIIQLAKQDCEKHNNSLMHLTLQLTEVQSQKSSLSNELQDRYQATMDAVEVELLSMDKQQLQLEKIEKEIKSTRKQQEAHQNVNLAAIEELGIQKERFDSIQKQKSDLHQSKAELQEMIKELESESKKLFSKTFEQIRENFKKNFSILFEGGEADLQLTRSDSILEAGVEIIAKPPGKQMRSISLLSGGEKCLTSMALLFAIFEVKPAPFCILDEIDAPLDDANVDRFTKMIHHFVESCQFLIISHNEKTMSIANMLYGVSMEEKGVSKVLALNFKDSAEPEPLLVST